MFVGTMSFGVLLELSDHK